MKKILTLTIPVILIFFSCCEKEDSLIPDIYWGEVTALKNGEPWNGKIRAAPNAIFGYGFDIRIDVYNGYDIQIESFKITKIPYLERYYIIDTIKSNVDSVLTGASYGTLLGGDVIGNLYNVFPGDINNFITVTSYNETTREVEGAFEVMFVKRPIQGYIGDPSSPDTLRFTNGIFHTKVNELE